MNYTQLTEGDRHTLATLKRQGLSLTNIEKAMYRESFQVIEALTSLSKHNEKQVIVDGV